VPSRRLVSWLPGRGNAANRTEPPFDPTSWSGALLVMVGVDAALWIVQLVNAGHDYSLNRFGLQPRTVDGLWGVLTAPFLHLNYGHLVSESVPVVAVGWVLLLSGLRAWLVVTGSVLVLGGLATWLVAPSALIVGSSSLVFGWLGYLLARAYFSRKLRWIVVALLVLFFFGALLSSLLPSFDKHASWQSHVCGFMAGIVVAAMLHPRPASRRASPPVVS
jgi:membrane associated rhomboid family serine protease